MKAKRRSIPLAPHEHELLKHLYLEFGIPSDQYRRRPRELERFVNRWNSLADRHDTTGEILHYIVTKRKSSQWVTFGGEHKRLDSMPPDFLPDSDWEVLRGVYEELVLAEGIGSDNLAFDDGLARSVATEFAKRAGHIIHAGLLFAAIMAKRKRGEWLKIERSAERKPDVGFDDIDEIAAG